MRITFLSFLILIWSYFVSYAQHCLPQGIIFSSQNEIDMFPTNYPDCFYIDGSVMITGDDITNLDSLGDLISISSDLYITGNNSLTDLTGLQMISSVQNLVVADNISLNSLTGLDNIDTITSGIRLSNNYNLTDIQALSSLKYIGPEAIISNNYSLESLQGLNNIRNFSGYLEIINNSGLQNLHGLENVDAVGNLIISGNENLLSLEGLSSLDTVYTNLFIESNQSLPDLMGLDQLKYVGWYFRLYGNSNLLHLLGLNNINSISLLDLIDNPMMQNLNGLSSLTILRGLNINYNNAMLSLEGLSSVSTIDWYLTIDDNALLTDITELADINLSQLGNLIILNNDSLSDCSISSICNYLQMQGAHHIDYNAPGCNSNLEIINRCITTTYNPQNSEVLIYPNPSDGIFYIESRDQLNGSISLYNCSGKELLNERLTKGYVDISNLSAGFYLVEIECAEKKYQGHLIKI